MSFGLGHGRALDPAVGEVLVGADELPPLPDDAVTNPAGALVDPRAWFADSSRPFELEIGSGKGTFLIQQAVLQPDVNFLGIEWANEFCTYAADRVRRRRAADGSLANVRLLRTDATEFLKWRCPTEICRVIHLYFSDPWPKTRHHKKRVVQHRFLLDAWRALAPGGELRVVTDHAELWAWDVEHFRLWAREADAESDTGSAPPLTRGERDASVRIPEMPTDVAKARAEMPEHPYEVLAFDRPESAGAGELVGTNFERKFREEGREFHAAVLKKLT